MFAGCDFEEQKPGIATIKNTSTNFDVAYVLGDYPEKTIVKETTDSFDRPLYAYVKFYEPSKRMLLQTEYPYKNDAVYTFSERKNYAVKVNNATGENVSLSADGWMEDMEGILPGNEDDANHVGIIYTDKPVFLVATESGFPAEVVYNFTNDIFLATIRWGN